MKLQVKSHEIELKKGLSRIFFGAGWSISLARRLIHDIKTSGALAFVELVGNG